MGINSNKNDFYGTPYEVGDYKVDVLVKDPFDGELN